MAVIYQYEIIIDFINILNIKQIFLEGFRFQGFPSHLGQVSKIFVFQNGYLYVINIKQYSSII